MRNLRLFVVVAALLVSSIAMAADVVATKLVMTIAPTGANALNQPSAIRVDDATGEIFVMDGANCRVMVFDQKGALKLKFGTRGRKEGQMLYPLGIEFDDNYIYVADSQNHRINLYSRQGKFRKSFLVEAREGLKKDPDPTNLLIVDGKLYVTDNDNHRIVVYDQKTLKQLFEFGKNGRIVGDFRFPFALARDKAQALFGVVDVINGRVQIFKYNGDPFTQIGMWGVKQGTFFRPKGIAIDSKSRVYVSDNYLDVVQIFTKDGILLYVLGNRNGKIMKMVKPFGMYVDGKDRLYVIEALANKISVFELME